MVKTKCKSGFSIIVLASCRSARISARALRANSQSQGPAVGSSAAPNHTWRSVSEAWLSQFLSALLRFTLAAGATRIQCATPRRGQGLLAPPPRGLTPHSSRGPTAKHRTRATVQVCFYCSAGPAFYRRSRLSSNVRQRSGNLVESRSSHGSSQSSKHRGHPARRQEHRSLRLH